MVDYIRAGVDGGGFRHFLDSKPVHAGDMLEAFVNGRWQPARYESNVGKREGYLHLDGSIRLTIGIICRWPQHDG